MNTEKRAEMNDMNITCRLDSPNGGNPTMTVTGRNWPEAPICDLANFEKLGGMWVLYELAIDEIFHPDAFMAIAIKLQELNKDPKIRELLANRMEGEQE